jgi:hypothetical protein
MRRTHHAVNMQALRSSRLVALQHDPELLEWTANLICSDSGEEEKFERKKE